METKFCRKCKEEKSLDEFYTSLKYYTRCKQCHKEYSKEYKRKRREENKDKWLSDKKKYNRIHYSNPKNSAERKEQMKLYNKINKDRINENYRRRNKLKYHSDPSYRIKSIIRRQVRFALDGKFKSETTFKLLGYTPEQLYKQLEPAIQYYKSQGIKYHMDHKIPLEWFKSDTPVKVSFDMRNLQILSETENVTKNYYYPSIADKDYMEEIRPYIKDEFLCW